MAVKVMSMAQCAFPIQKHDKKEDQCPHHHQCQYHYHPLGLAVPVCHHISDTNMAWWFTLHLPQHSHDSNVHDRTPGLCIFPSIDVRRVAITAIPIISVITSIAISPTTSFATSWPALPSCCWPWQPCAWQGGAHSPFISVRRRVAAAAQRARAQQPSSRGPTVLQLRTASCRRLFWERRLSFLTGGQWQGNLWDPRGPRGLLELSCEQKAKHVKFPLVIILWAKASECWAIAYRV